MAAMQEGRLPPIHENKTYPRRTMRYVTMTDQLGGCSRSANPGCSHAELLAVCTEAEDTNDSPDLGPPPTSRFVEEDPVKIDSPTRSTGMLEPSPKISPKIKGEALPRPDAPAQPKLDPKKQPAPATENVTTDDAQAANITDASSRPLLKAGSKRKFGDENHENQTSRSSSDKEKIPSESALDKPLAIADVKNRRNSKGRPKSAQVTESTTMRPRKPLTDKSTNDDLVSPKKMTKSATTGDLKKTMAEVDRAVAPMKKRVVPIKLTIPSLPAPSMVKEPHEPATPSADPYIASPSTPETKSTFDNPGDTPPPVDISVYGETSRPSRRVRAAISYAEPSLRDKMRRPTKQLYDAVSGEGKYIRSSSTHPVGPLSSAKTKTDDEGSAAGDSKPPPTAEAAMTHEAARRPTVVSPLLQREPSKEQSKAELPDSVVTERRRRQSSKETQIYEDEQEEEEAAEETKPSKTDPYEFLSTPPALAPPKQATVHKGRITKGMRRSIMAASGHGSDATDGSRPSRKRVSMAAPKKASMLDSPDDDDSTYEASGGETTKAERSSSMVDRTSRRKSMML